MTVLLLLQVSQACVAPLLYSRVAKYIRTDNNNVNNEVTICDANSSALNMKPFVCLQSSKGKSAFAADFQFHFLSSFNDLLCR